MYFVRQKAVCVLVSKSVFSRSGVGLVNTRSGVGLENSRLASLDATPSST